jgi:glycosyltransferase involved in cell wall biosynthesis
VNSHGWPIGVRMVDVRQPVGPLTDVSAYPRVRVFVIDGPDLIGSVDIWNARRTIGASRLREAIAQTVGYQLAKRGLSRQLAPDRTIETLPSDVPVSIVVPTSNRPGDLRRCLESLHAQRSTRPLEIVVVDNRPGQGTAQQVTRDFPMVTVIEESRGGLSYARNAGFLAARGEILVATDDDVVAPPTWIERLVAPFTRPEVAAVTGNVLPLELETEAQCRFEAYGGLGKGFEPIEVSRDWFAAFRGAVPTWRLGATANAAFRASALHDPAIGMFDEALGAGTPTGCSEDTYLFYRLLKADRTLVYDPSVYVWHRHRQTSDALRKQIFDYSKGHVAYQLTTLLNEHDARALVRLGWSLPKTYVRRAIQRLRQRSEYPLDLIALEILGNLAGPWSLWRSRRRVRRLGRSAIAPRDRVRADPALHDVA